MSWPSAEEQIAAAGVDPNSPLAQLIRENSSEQDMALLHPAEAQHEAGLPAWFRAYWRKQHPEAEFSAADPASGYPHAARTLYDWMQAHPSLKPEPPPQPTPPPDDAGAH